MAIKRLFLISIVNLRKLRDDIIAALGDDATYYKDETVDSKDMTDLKRKPIEKNLADMMYDTSVTIVILNWREYFGQFFLDRPKYSCYFPCTIKCR